MNVVTCLHCGGTKVSRTKQTKYCSVECRLQASFRKHNRLKWRRRKLAYQRRIELILLMLLRDHIDESDLLGLVENIRLLGYGDGYSDARKRFKKEIEALKAQHQKALQKATTDGVVLGATGLDPELFNS